MALLEIIQLLHLIGIAWGVGGATVSAILMMRSEKNPEIAPYIMRIMPSVSKLMWLAVVLLIVSGIALTQLVTRPINSTVLITKHVVVLLLILNSINLSFRVLPKMERIAPKDGKPSEDFLKLKKTAKITGFISISLWYVILVLSVMM